MNFNELLTEYSFDLIDHSQFLLNALIAALLTWILSVYYRRYGKSVGNRAGFGSNFMLLALTTMLIIYIVKSSIALSLGLVGALSIVRFRAAIKEPEELTYLFLVIGIGLGMGANQPGITVLAFVLIMALMVLKTRTKGFGKKAVYNQMLVNITTQKLDETAINDILKKEAKGVELRRMTHDKGSLLMTFVIEMDDFEQLSKTKSALLSADKDLIFSFVDNKNLAN